MLEEALYVRLTGDAAVTAIVGTAVYPQAAPQNLEPPFITYARVSAERLRSFDGPSGLARPRMQVDCWAAGYRQARQLADATRRALDGWRSPADGVPGAMLESDRDLHEPENGLHRVSMDFFFWHEES